MSKYIVCHKYAAFMAYLRAIEDGEFKVGNPSGFQVPGKAGNRRRLNRRFRRGAYVTLNAADARVFTDQSAAEACAKRMREYCTDMGWEAVELKI